VEYVSLIDQSLIKRLMSFYDDFYRRYDDEAVGYITSYGKIVFLFHDTNWSEYFGCKAYDQECVLSIREYLREHKAEYTFHTHPPEYLFGSYPSSNDVLAAYLLDYPDIIIHKNSISIIKPKIHMLPHEVWNIERECIQEYFNSGEDYYIFIGCIFRKLPVYIETIKVQ